MKTESPALEPSRLLSAVTSASFVIFGILQYRGKLLLQTPQLELENNTKVLVLVC